VISDALVFLRKHLDDHLRMVLGGSQDEPSGDKVVFVDGDQMDPISFKLGAVTVLLINLEEERVLRGPDLHVRRSADGHAQRVQPDIRLILHVLFVARFKQYEFAWRHLSKVIEHLQSVRVFDAGVAPELPAGIEKLVVELVTLNFAEQNEVWNALRTTHHPSVLYRVKLITFRDQQATESTEIAAIDQTVRRVSS
jgi:hypothetical protein